MRLNLDFDFRVKGRFISHDKLDELALETSRKIRETIEERFITGNYLPGTDRETYNEEYAERRKGGRLAPVDMWLAGDMRSAITPIHELRGGNDYIAGITVEGNDAQKVWYHHFAGAGPNKIRRKFWALTDDEVRYILRRAGEATDYGIKRF